MEGRSKSSFSLFPKMTSKMTSKVVQNWSKIHPKSSPVGSRKRSRKLLLKNIENYPKSTLKSIKGTQKGASVPEPLLGPQNHRFWTILAPKMIDFWWILGPQINQKSIPNQSQICSTFLRFSIPLARYLLVCWLVLPCSFDRFCSCLLVLTCADLFLLFGH